MKFLVSPEIRHGYGMINLQGKDMEILARLNLKTSNTLFIVLEKWARLLPD